MKTSLKNIYMGLMSAVVLGVSAFGIVDITLQQNSLANGYLNKENNISIVEKSKANPKNKEILIKDHKAEMRAFETSQEEGQVLLGIFGLMFIYSASVLVKSKKEYDTNKPTDELYDLGTPKTN